MSERGSFWIGRGGMVLVVAGLAAMVMGYFVGVETYGIWLMLAGFVMALIGVMLAGKFTTSREPKGAVRSGESRRDSEQRKWATSVLIVPVGSLPMCIFSSDALLEMVHGSQPTVTSAMVLGPLMIGLGFVVLVRGLSHKDAQKWLNDELMRAYLASAMGWGFVAAFLGLCVVFGVMLWRMPMVLPLMPMVMWLVLGVASVRLWWQVRRADG